MRAMWKGAVSFGLVNVPVKMYTATTSHDIAFHQVHRKDGGRIRYRRVCQVCGEEVAYDEIAKGYESPEGDLVVLTDEDLAELPVSGSREIDVERFVPADQLDPMLLDKSYYLEPEKSGVKPYALLREALKASDRMALVHVAIRARSTLAVLRVRDDVIVLQTMLWPDEIRAADFDTLGDAEELRPQELAMASSLIESMAGEYDPDEFDDEYRDAVAAIVEGKLDKGESSKVPDEPGTSSVDSGQVLDLMAALQRSVDAAKGKPEPAAAADEPAAKTTKKAAAKKTASKTASTTATKKTAAKKTAAKKTTAKKTAAKAEEQPASRKARSA
ncbi:Ku protein [Angustibacter sp. McL0619]|uniref:non-homologous end joining protein Ku n=1 Tax=Angustibacter sp. McL0619 TaxID=3415676 RepID=UPI003CF54D5F